MEKIKLIVESNKGPLEVNWSNGSELAKYANIQSGFYLQETRESGTTLLKQHFANWNQMFWSMREEMDMFNIPDGATIVDIGSGIGVIDLLLYSYIPNSTFYLIDKEGWDDNFATTVPPNRCYESNYPIYNSWAPVKDAIHTSKFDINRFIFSPANMPNQVDVIMSWHSWCFHYPKEAYWDAVLSSLKFGGKLLLDVRLLLDRDVIGEISEELKCDPIKRDFPKLPSHVDNYSSNGWSRCMWTKNI